MDAQAMGRKGGEQMTEKQQLARRKNILLALSKRHPQSTRIRQQLQLARMAERAEST